VHSGMFLSLFKMQNCFFSSPRGNSFELSYASLLFFSHRIFAQSTTFRWD